MFNDHFCASIYLTTRGTYFVLSYPRGGGKLKIDKIQDFWPTVRLHSCDTKFFHGGALHIVKNGAILLKNYIIMAKELFHNNVTFQQNRSIFDDVKCSPMEKFGVTGVQTYSTTIEPYKG